MWEKLPNLGIECYFFIRFDFIINHFILQKLKSLRSSLII